LRSIDQSFSAREARKAWAQGILAGAWCLIGEPGKAIELLEPLIQISRAGRFAVGELVLGETLARAYLLSGEYENARKTLEDHLKLANRCRSSKYIALAHYWLGEVALKMNPAQAGIHFERSIAITQQIKAENNLALSYSGLGRFYKRQGDAEQAYEYLTQALEIFERLGTLIEPDRVKKELAELPEEGNL